MQLLALSQCFCNPDLQSTRATWNVARLAVGPSGITAEILKAASKEGVELARQLTEAVFSCGVIPVDWKESSILNLYIRARVTHLTMAAIVVSSSQVKSWSCWNESQTPASETWWTPTRFILALCMAEVLLTPSSLFASCRINALLLPNCSTLPSLILRKPLIWCQERSYGEP